MALVEYDNRNSKDFVPMEIMFIFRRLKATHPVVEVLGRSLLTGWLAGLLAEEMY